MPNNPSTRLKEKESNDSRDSPKRKKDRSNQKKKQQSSKDNMRDKSHDNRKQKRNHHEDQAFEMNQMRRELRRLEDPEAVGTQGKSSSHSSVIPGTPSRIPLYTANGLRPHHLNSPAHSSSRSRNLSGGSDVRRLVPSHIQRQHMIHTLENHSSSFQQTSRSVPVSGRTTPTTNFSLTSTPYSSRRPSFTNQLPSSSKPGNNVSKQQQTINNSSNKIIHSCTSSSSSGNGNSQLGISNQAQNKNSHHRDCCLFAEYMPLCELQRGLKRGEVLEGILRINAKNFEDAYISAPVILGILDFRSLTLV